MVWYQMYTQKSDLTGFTMVPIIQGLAVVGAGEHDFSGHNLAA